MDIRTDSTEYVYATVTSDHDLTGMTIDVALPTTGSAPSSWYTATVTEVDQIKADRWTATYRLLIGPSGGALTLAAGTYDWTVRLTDAPELPVRKTGTLTATAS